MSDQARKILVCVAWPYANGEKHIGQIAGAYLPPDIFARYQRMAGNDVLMVSGSDTHGTPITLQAENEGIEPAAVVDKYHEMFVDGCLAMGLTFDLYTHTDTQNHWDVTQQVFRRHLANEFIYTEVQKQWYDPEAGRFLADRYVEGRCPFCGYAGARGDQCDECGRLYDALELTDTRSKLSGSTRLEVRETEHFFLDLGALNEPLLAWIGSGKEHWRSNVLNFTQGQLNLKELRGRAITRDIDWGIDIPLEGYEDKRIYVWYDAVQGYLSAAIEWGQTERRRVAGVVGSRPGAGCPPLLLHRQGQYPVSHADLAGNDHGLQRRIGREGIAAAGPVRDGEGAGGGRSQFAIRRTGE